jgi:hypothetical protein
MSVSVKNTEPLQRRQPGRFQSSNGPRSLRYTDAVRRTLIGFLLVLAATLPVIDTVSCPDGCTEGRHELTGRGSETGSHEGACLLCAGGYGIANIATAQIAFDFVSPLSVPAPPRIISKTPRSLDHPPRP